MEGKRNLTANNGEGNVIPRVFKGSNLFHSKEEVELLLENLPPILQGMCLEV